MAHICKCVREFQHEQEMADIFKRERNFESLRDGEESKKHILAHAASKGHINCVKSLLRLGAKTEVPEDPENPTHSWPVLIEMLELSRDTHRANKHLECALLLAGAGAKVDLDDEVHAVSAFSVFQKNRKLTETDAAIITLLLKVNVGEHTIEQSDGFGRTFLCCAAAAENFKLVETFLAMGADPNLSTPNVTMTAEGPHPVEEAAQTGNVAMLTLLLEAGGHATGRALLKALLHGHSQCATILAQANAPITVDMLSFGFAAEVMADRPWHVLFTNRADFLQLPEDFDLKLLEMGANKLYLDLVRVILEAGIDPSLSDLLNGKLEKNMPADVMVKSVVENFCSGNWRRALANIVKSGCEKDIALLVESSITNNKRDAIVSQLKEEMYQTCSLSVTKGVFKALLKFGSNVDECNDMGETALMKMASSRYAEIPQMLYLIQQGADINAVDTAGRNALMHICAYLGDFSNLVELLRAGVLVNRRDSEGRNALGWMEWFGPERRTCLQILLIGGEIDARFSINEEGEVVSSDEELTMDLGIELDNKLCVSSLKSLSRNAVRHCLSYSGATNLFISIPRLGQSEVNDQMPIILACLVPYLLFGFDLDDFVL